jgi:hypothetical protein
MRRDLQDRSEGRFIAADALTDRATKSAGMATHQSTPALGRASVASCILLVVTHPTMVALMRLRLVRQPRKFR